MKDVILHQLAHKSIDGAASCGQTLQDVGAMGVFFQSAQRRFQLADDLFGTGNKLKFFA